MQTEGRAKRFYPFPNTHWSLVRRAGGTGEEDAQARREALSRLLARYEPALRSYLLFARRMPEEAAAELLQAFITDRLLEHELLRRADETRGRFRSLLLTSLNNFHASRLRSDRRRAAAPLDETVPDAGSSGAAPSAIVETAWARALVQDVIVAMREECERSGRGDVWRVFECRVLAEVFGDRPAIPYEELARNLNLKSPAQASNLLVTAKRMYARLLRAAVAEYEEDEEGVAAELADLQRSLAGPAGRDAEQAEAKSPSKRKSL